MSLLSMTGLKKAYESLGEELTRTFDSSQSTESVDGGSGPAGEGSQLARVSDAGTQEKVIS